MKIFLVFTLLLICGLAHGKSVSDSSSMAQNPQNNHLEDQTITRTNKMKISIPIMITGILLVILVSLGCTMANNYTSPKFQYISDISESED